MSGHNIIGEPTTEIIPDLIKPGDWIVRGKKRYSPFHDTDLGFLLDRRLQVDTLILAGINTTSCVLCCGFEATNRDYRVVIAADAVDSTDGEEMHDFALRLMAATIGWVLANDEIIAGARRAMYRAIADCGADAAMHEIISQDDLVILGELERKSAVARELDCPQR